MRSSDNYLKAISQEIPHLRNLARELSIYKFHLNLPGVNELTYWRRWMRYHPSRGCNTKRWSRPGPCNCRVGRSSGWWPCWWPGRPCWNWHWSAGLGRNPEKENTVIITKFCTWHDSSTAVVAGATRTTRTPAFWDTPCRPMITHTSDSMQIPSQNKAKSKLQILKNCKNSNFEILQETLHATHIL